jgi:parallel beta helix pectate lyase-like protein
MSIRFACCGLLSTLFVVVSVPSLQAAQLVAYVSSTGSGAVCTAAQPCASFFSAHSTLVNGGQISCLNSPTLTDTGLNFNGAGLSVVIDCVGVYAQAGNGFGMLISGANQVIKIRNLTFSGSGGTFPALEVTGSGTLILENCVFENTAGIALDIEPNGALTLIVKNSRVSNSTAAGVIIKPAAGGSVKATFDGVTITNNAGGLKTDTTNGSVTVDISNSTISNNANNGLVAIGGAGGQNMVTAKNDVIASNGQAGIEASGGTAGVIVNNTVLDSNITGATLALSGGRILTYGNNSTIGTPGSGFTGTAPLN